jgi:hypothetical protein
MSQDVKGFIRNSVSIKALIIIAAISIGYQAYISSGYVSDEETSFADFSYGISSLAVGIVALFVAKRYWGSPVFGKTYFVLAIGFILLFVGDSIVYNYYLYVLDEDPYPSLADVFFIGFYFFTGYHLVKNIKYFKKDLSWAAKINVVIIAAVMIVGFAAFTIETLYDDPVVYYMSMAYVVGSAAILALAILGLTVFRHSVLGVAWGMLVVGIFLYSIADIWYYYLEEIGEFSITNPVNTLWILSNAFMIYALYKHQKTI